MQHVSTRDGTRLYVKDWGKGRPVVMLHGWPLSSDTFDDLALLLVENGYRAIRYDRRGFGRSGQPGDGYDYDTLADDLAAVIRATQSDDVTLLGFSMGGGEVARYLSRHGARGVRQAILIAAVVPSMLKTDTNPDGVVAEVFEQMAAEIRRDRASFWPGFFKDFYGVGVLRHPVSDEVIDWSCALAMQAGLLPTIACAEAFSMTDFGPDLAAFTVPTLVLHGTGDQTVPIATSARRAVPAIRDCVVREYEDAPHGLLASHKDDVAADVLAFLRGAPLPERVPADLTTPFIPVNAPPP
jgi:pimeloyl-ACP methyl ester carboxylesterase